MTVLAGDEVIGSTLSSTERSALLRRGGELPLDGTLDLADEPVAVRRLSDGGPIIVYGTETLGLSTHRATRNAIQILSIVAVGAMALGALVSLWLARVLAKPIDQLSQQLRVRSPPTHEFARKIARTGSSLELDAFTDTFNQMVTSLQAAEAQTELAYVDAIKALAAALDARDAYTAGHSERVSALSVIIGRQMGLDQPQLDVLRLGALLHDIGKIGVADRVLQKNGPLTQEEFEIDQDAPGARARTSCVQIPFLSAHIPIVELHHERPDGRGYPRGPARPRHADARPHRPCRRRLRRHDDRARVPSGTDEHARDLRAVAVRRIAVRRRGGRGVRRGLVGDAGRRRSEPGDDPRNSHRPSLRAQRQARRLRSGYPSESLVSSSRAFSRS